MTSRERFHLTMKYGEPDRAPWLEEGLRDDVLARWRGEGLPADADLGRLFGYDRRERIELDLAPRKQPGAPAIVDEDPAELRRRLDPDDPARWPADWAARVERWCTREHIVELFLHRGLFLTLGVQGWAELEQVLYLLADEPARARALLDVQAELTAAMARRVLAEVEIDIASFSEPIGDNHGPLVSPRLYREIVLPSLAPILEVLREHRVEVVAFLTYGNARCLLPDVLKAGFNCLWAMETETQAMDYRELRREFGRSLRLIGGIDLDCLSRGPAAIEREIMEKVPPLLEQGGYIPLADGRVRACIPWESYRCYRRLLERVTQPESE